MEEIEKAFQARQRRLENESRQKRRNTKRSESDKLKADQEAKKAVLAKLGLSRGSPPKPRPTQTQQPRNPIVRNNPPYKPN